MGDLGYLDEHGKLWFSGRKAHAVHAKQNQNNKIYFSIPCERIFNTHPAIKRSALVNVSFNGETQPLVCIELADNTVANTNKLFNELRFIAERHPQTSGINQFLIHPAFPMDIRHNAKIFREKLASWAQQKITN